MSITSFTTHNQHVRRILLFLHFKDEENWSIPFYLILGLYKTNTVFISIADMKDPTSPATQTSISATDPWKCGACYVPEDFNQMLIHVSYLDMALKT